MRNQKHAELARQYNITRKAINHFNEELKNARGEYCNCIINEDYDLLEDYKHLIESYESFIKTLSKKAKSIKKAIKPCETEHHMEVIRLKNESH